MKTQEQKLIFPQEEYWQSFQEAMRAFTKLPTSFDIKEIKRGLAFDNFADYKESCENARKGIGLALNHVPHTSLWLIHDEKFVGLFDIRHSLTKSLKLCGGNIAYEIVPSERKKGLATEGLKLCCRYAHDFLGINDVLITCNATNVASYKVMKKVMIEYGGVEATPVVIDNHEEKRVWIRTKPRPLQIRPLAVAVIKKDNKVLAFKGFDDKKGESFYRLIGGGSSLVKKVRKP